MKLSDDKIIENTERVMRLVDKFDEPRRTKVKEMLDGDVGKAYFTAPASSREKFHSCFPGGLCYHSLKVVDNLWKLASTLCPKKYDPKKLSFVGLFHDFGKVGDGVEEYYIPHHSDWHKKQGALYEKNEKCIPMPTSERGLYVLQKYGIDVDSDEYLSIRLNDGMYDETNSWYKMKEPELALLTHWADRWACAEEKLES